MSFDALTNRGEYLSAYYLAEVLPRDLRKKDEGLLARWAAQEEAGRETPRLGIRALRREYLAAKAELADLGDEDKRRQPLRDLHTRILERLGYIPRPATPPPLPPREPQPITVERAGREHQIPVAHAEPGITVIECGWAVDADAVTDPDDAGRLLHPVELDRRERIDAGFALAGWLFSADQQPPRYVLILSGAVLTLADRLTWGEGRYLSVSLDAAFARNDTRAAGELDVIAALFGADSLRPPAEGGAEPLAALVAGSRQHTVGVSPELREGLRLSVEYIANEVLNRIRQAGVRPEQLMEPAELGRELTREALRYLYRILFLLYAEARPELGVLPVDYPEYVDGYSLTRLGNLVTRPMVGQSAATGFHLHESLDLLFRMVNTGYRPRGAGAVSDTTSEGEGIRFEPLKSDLFLPEAIRYIGPAAFTHPDDDPDDEDARTIDTRLRNSTLHTVLRLLMLTRGRKKERGGFISYAQLGINQLGAVYEGLMSYTGFIASEELYEVAKGSDPSDGSWMIPASTVDNFPDEVFVTRLDDETSARSRVRYPAGSFVYRLAGRDRQTSASYYTPQSLTEVTVQLALKYLIEEQQPQRARDLLDWTICEPALGSGAFLNEAINQVAAEYLRRAQEETTDTLDPEQYVIELQKVKAYIALHNCYGVDLNRTAAELAEVSIWLNVMHAGLQAPWFGLHLRRGNSLIGASRRTYPVKALGKERSWLSTAPDERPFRDGAIPTRAVHHFLLPADGWGAVAKDKEARAWAPDDAKRLAEWRRRMLKAPESKAPNNRRSQLRRLQALAGRVERFWDLVQQRLEKSEHEIRRDIKVWGATGLPPVRDAVSREKIIADLEAEGSPYWRLKTLMDAWCALWFWPLDRVDLLDGTARDYANAHMSITRIERVPVVEPAPEPASWENGELFGLADIGLPEQLTLPTPAAPGSKPTPTRQRTVLERLTGKAPLSTLEDWLDFCEALIGSADDAENTLNPPFEDLAEIEQYEREMHAWTGMDAPHRIKERFPWLDTVEEIADQQGFFHWELHFAQVFARGGFDLQVGNPPWVRPRWDEGAVLAEHDPWFTLEDGPTASEWSERKSVHIGMKGKPRLDFLGELAVNTGLVAFLGSTPTYPLLAGTQPDLYRAFMCRVWSNLSRAGTAGLIHPDSHFTGAHEGALRAATYQYLRLHGHFQNRRLIFPDVDWNKQFGVHIYRSASSMIDFDHACWLFDPSVLADSVDHDGEGEEPGIKYRGYWDLRPHRARILRVNSEMLVNWQRLTGGADGALHETRLLYPVSAIEQAAISALAGWDCRLGVFDPPISRGFDESGAKRAGLIRSEFAKPDHWRDVVLRGPQFLIATPFAKQPPHTGRSDKAVDITSLGDGAVPSTDYVRACSWDRYISAQDVWTDYGRLADLNGSPVAREAARREVETASDREATDGEVDAHLRVIARRPYSAFYRVAWREMVPASTERSLFPTLLPPGPTHIHGIRTMALPSNRLTALIAGFWASIPLDYALRIAGKGHLDVADAKTMPAPQPNHPLSSALLLRTLRLNCLTVAYADLWAELYDPKWSTEDSWAANWEGLSALNTVGPDWQRNAPLRSERERRSALVEIDALVSAWLGIGADELVAIYLSRFPQLVDYEADMWFDANGRKITSKFDQWGHGQTKEHFVQLMAYQEDPTRTSPPDGYSPPFYRADRPQEMREAHTVFSARLQAAKDAGWSA